MLRRFHVTCARTSYVDIEVEAEDEARAARLLEAALEEDHRLFDQGQPLGQPLHRIVSATGAGEASSGLKAEAA